MKVVLQRTESQDEYGRRLAGLVMNRLRLPRARAVFAATLVRALRGVSEANEVMVVVVMAILSLISFLFCYYYYRHYYHYFFLPFSIHYHLLYPFLKGGCGDGHQQEVPGPLRRSSQQRQLVFSEG
jgi:hypothetical protein